MRAAPSRTVSIYRSLFGSLLLVIAMLSGVVFGMTFLQSRRTVRALSRTAIEQSAAEVEAKLHGMFRPVESMLLLARDYGRAGRLDFEDTEQFFAAMAPVVQRQIKVTSLLLADETGRERMLLDCGDAWLTRESDPQQWGDETVWTERETLDAAPVYYEENRPYDCRQRPWFTQAVADEARWTAPYPFATTGDPGITVSIRFAGTDGLARVIAFDVKLEDISSFTMRLRPTPGGRAIVLDGEGRVLGLPGDTRFQDPKARAAALLKRPFELGIPVVDDAAEAYWKGGGKPDAPYRFESGGHAWWAGLREFRLDRDRALALAVVIPESDLLGQAQEQRLWILLATAAVLGFAAWYATRLARRYSEPIGALVRQSARIRGGDFDPAEPIESRLREVRALANAQDEMRVGLRTLLKLERDLQIARQIQQKSLPERLPRLKGFEIAAWSEPADETGGDTYDVVGFRRVERGGAVTTAITEGDADGALLLLADATGHGIGPALSVTQVRSMLRMAARQGVDLERCVGAMNEQLHADLTADRFVTAWFGVLDAPTRMLTAFSAGQGPILHYVAARDEFVAIQSDGPPLGVVEDLPIRIKPAIRLEPGDLYLVCSDGFDESKSADREMFGVERMTDVVRRHRHRTPAAILDALREAVDGFTEHASLEDDRTALLIRCG